MTDSTIDPTTADQGDVDATSDATSEPPASEPPAKPAQDIEYWKRRARDNEKAAKANADAARRLAEIEDEQKSDLERAQAKADAADARTALLMERTLRAESKVIATELAFADPADAALYISLSTYVDGDGMVDADQLKADLAAVLEAKPHLRRNDAPAPRFPGNADGAPRNGAEPQTLDQQIRAANLAGNHKLAIALKTQQLAALTSGA